MLLTLLLGLGKPYVYCVCVHGRCAPAGSAHGRPGLAWMIYEVHHYTENASQFYVYCVYVRAAAFPRAAEELDVTMLEAHMRQILPWSRARQHPMSTVCVCMRGSLPGRGGGAGRDHAGGGAAAGAGRARGRRAGDQGAPGPVWHSLSSRLYFKMTSDALGDHSMDTAARL